MKSTQEKQESRLTILCIGHYQKLHIFLYVASYSLLLFFIFWLKLIGNVRHTPCLTALSLNHHTQGLHSPKQLAGFVAKQDVQWDDACAVEVKTADVDSFDFVSEMIYNRKNQKDVKRKTKEKMRKRDCHVFHLSHLLDLQKIQCVLTTPCQKNWWQWFTYTWRNRNCQGKSTQLERKAGGWMDG